MHSPSQPSPNTMEFMLAMGSALLCILGQMMAQGLLFPWLEGFPNISLGL